MVVFQARAKKVIDESHGRAKALDLAVHIKRVQIGLTNKRLQA